MPIPKPSKGEKQSDFIARCIKQLNKEDSNRKQDKITAICYQQWKNKESVEPMVNEQFKKDEDGHFIIAENIPIIFNAVMAPVIKEEKSEESNEDKTN